MDRHFELIPEDGAIQELVKVLGFRKPNTAQGIGDTLNKIEKQFRNRFAIGIIDDDVRKPKLFDTYALLEEQDDLRLYQKPGSRHYLIVVEPAIERWLLDQAQKIELDSPFPALKDLQRITKNEIEVVKNQQFKRFLHQLSQGKASGFETLYDWITELYDKYQ